MPAASPDHPDVVECSIDAALRVVHDRWTLLILRDVFRGTRRFTQIQRDLGIARNVLASRIAALVEEGLLERVAYQRRPLRHEYRLTPKGADLSPALLALMRWGDRWYAPHGPPTELVHDQCGTPLVHRPRCPTCDEVVPPGHVRGRPGPGRRNVQPAASASEPRP